MMVVRRPAVAGQFYPYSAENLQKAVESCFKHWKIRTRDLKNRTIKNKVLGAVVPHAGYRYSGPVAASVYAKLQPADTFVILGPNHSGMGPDAALMMDGTWQTPLGDVHIDEDMARDIVSDSNIVTPDESAHEREHSIEVQLPFIQTIAPKAEIVPISIKHYYPEDKFLSLCTDIGKTIASVVKDSGKQTIILASTDFSHYEPLESASSKDERAMDAILSRSPENLFKAVKDEKISMCGYGGVASMLTASAILGARRAEKVSYMTSGDTTGDNSSVVGYGGAIVL